MPLAKRTPVVVVVDPGHPPIQPINDILAPSDHGRHHPCRTPLPVVEYGMTRLIAHGRRFQFVRETTHDVRTPKRGLKQRELFNEFPGRTGSPSIS
jgi:hypothetical protein